MCGVIGVIATPGISPASRVEAGLASLRHRGPNHQQASMYAVAGREIWLGHTRLSIIDLDSEANQPMCSEDGRYVIIFNGEIYNYIELRQELKALGKVFRTNSDTEVLLQSWAHWGDACLERLDGMFAFVVLDKFRQTMTCARDPFGIKPFFYTVQNHELYFASELPALLNILPSRPGPDVQRACDYLILGDYDSNEHTFVDGVKHLLPAHVMTWCVPSGGVKSIRRWWLPRINQTSTLSFQDAADAMREQFLQNVRRQLRSDVPLGAALSGGIDSSAVVCAIRYLEPDLPIHTFSFIASDAAASEDRWVDMVNQRVGAISHKIHVDATDLARDIDDVVRAQGEPFGSTSIYAQYRVFKLARESDISVTLDGQGADELLAGYSGYPGLRAMSLVDEGRFFEALRFVDRWRKWRGGNTRQAITSIARAFASDRIYAWLQEAGGQKIAPKWLRMDLLHSQGVCTDGMIFPRVDANRGRRLVEFLAGSLQNTGLPGLLRHGDRNSMRFSIESRVPFLTVGMTDLAYSLPEPYLLSDAGETKSVFRAAMRGLVPDAVLDRRDKIGFATPERRWFLELASKYREWTQMADCIPFLDVKNLRDEFDAIYAGKKRFTWQVWRWVNYIRWYGMVFNT